MGEATRNLLVTLIGLSLATITAVTQLAKLKEGTAQPGGVAMLQLATLTILLSLSMFVLFAAREWREMATRRSQERLDRLQERATSEYGMAVAKLTRKTLHRNLVLAIRWYGPQRWYYRFLPPCARESPSYDGSWGGVLSHGWIVSFDEDRLAQAASAAMEELARECTRLDRCGRWDEARYRRLTAAADAAWAAFMARCDSREWKSISSSEAKTREI